MSELSPQSAATLAKDVYLLQSTLASVVDDFIESRPEFSTRSGTSVKLNADVGTRLINKRDGFGICVRGRNQYKNDLFMIFRGTTKTNYGADIFTDLRIGVERSRTGMSVHVGFNHAFCSMLPDLEAFLANHADAGGTVHCIGHSLGGAVAALAADWLNAQGKNVKLYTFGAPKPGLEDFATRLTREVETDNNYRVYHSTDVVSMLPVYPFAHSPTDHYGYQIPSRGLISFSAHKIANYSKAVEDASWEKLGKRAELTAYPGPIEHWLKSDRPVNPADPRTWSWLNAALVWVLRRVVGGSIVVLQSPFVSVLSLADKISWILRRGIDLSADAAGWGLRLMRKIMQALGMKIAKTAAELTRQFMNTILVRLLWRMGNEAQRAIRGLMTQV